MIGKKLTKFADRHVYPCPKCGKIPKLYMYPDKTAAVVMCRTRFLAIQHAVAIIPETTPDNIISDAVMKWNSEVIRQKIEEMSNATNTEFGNQNRSL